jgi:hypothetical protein
VLTSMVAHAVLDSHTVVSTTVRKNALLISWIPEFIL